MSRENAPIIKQYYDLFRPFVNAMQNAVKVAYQRRKTATDVPPRTQPRPSRIPALGTAPSPIPPNLSEFSSPSVPNSAWCSQNFMLGAGMVILQPSTHKVVVVYETERKYWFFPKGRKDRGESLETTAIREAYEEVRILRLISAIMSLFRVLLVRVRSYISTSVRRHECAPASERKAQDHRENHRTCVPFSTLMGGSTSEPPTGRKAWRGIFDDVVCGSNSGRCGTSRAWS